MVFLFIGSAQSGLLVIANATPMLSQTAQTVAFLAANAWLLSSFGGLINAAGRVGTGLYSDRIGRANAYRINGIVATVSLFLTPLIMRSGSVPCCFLAVGLAYWQYGGGLVADARHDRRLFGSNDLGLKYGPGVFGMGHRLSCAADRRLCQRPDRKSRLRLLSFRKPDGVGRDLERTGAATVRRGRSFCARCKGRLSALSIVVAP